MNCYVILRPIVRRAGRYIRRHVGHHAAAKLSVSAAILVVCVGAPLAALALPPIGNPAWDRAEGVPFRPVDVPEPASIAVLGAGLVALGVVRR